MAAPALDPVLSPPVRAVSINPTTLVTYELTGLIEGLSYSNVDPGGDEQATFTYRRSWAATLPELQRGNLLRITAGLDVVWQGRIEEADRGADQTETVTVTAYGLGTRLKDNTMREIYVDRDLGRWGPTSLGQRAALGSTWTQNDPDTILDTTTGLPGLESKMAGAMPTNTRWSAWYDAGVGLGIARVYIGSLTGINLLGHGGDANNNGLVYGFDTDLEASASVNSGDISSSASVDYTLSTAKRFIEFNFWRTLAGGTEGADFGWRWANIAVYGSHGLTVQGAMPGGFSPDQIVGNVVARVSGITQRQLDAQPYVIPHFTVIDPTHHEDVITAAASYVDTCWGTWGPTSPLDSSLNGYFDFATRDRTTQHWFAYRVETDALALHSETATLYNRVDVHYTDAAGATFIETRSAYVTDLDSQGITRTASLDAGVSTQPVAQALGDLFLSLYGGFAPARGSVTFLRPITHYRRGKISPVYMRADGSNLRLADVLPTQTLFGLDAAPDRRSTFPIKRVTVDLSTGAVPSASCDLDQASDELAALLARTALDAQYNRGYTLPPGIQTGASNVIDMSTNHHHHHRHRHPNQLHNAHETLHNAPGHRRRHHH